MHIRPYRRCFDNFFTVEKVLQTAGKNQNTERVKKSLGTLECRLLWLRLKPALRARWLFDSPASTLAINKVQDNTTKTSIRFLIKGRRVWVIMCSRFDSIHGSAINDKSNLLSAHSKFYSIFLRPTRVCAAVEIYPLCSERVSVT